MAKYIFGKDETGAIVVGLVQKSDDANYELVGILPLLSDKKYISLVGSVGWTSRNKFCFCDNNKFYEFDTLAEQKIRDEDGVKKLLLKFKEDYHEKERAQKE